MQLKIVKRDVTIVVFLILKNLKKRVLTIIKFQMKGMRQEEDLLIVVLVILLLVVMDKECLTVNNVRQTLAILLIILVMVVLRNLAMECLARVRPVKRLLPVLVNFLKVSVLLLSYWVVLGYKPF